MKNDKNTTNSQLDDLLDEAKKLNDEIDDTGREARKNIDELNTEIDKSISDLEKNCSDLDEIEKGAGDELDKLVLEEAENLANE
jgi:DNA repair ATPase RecN